MSFVESELEKMGYPCKDAYHLPDSGIRFADGAHFRNEIAGIEDPQTMETTVEESERRKVPVHRIIATVGGANLLTNSDLAHICTICKEKGYELVVNPAASRSSDNGRQYVTPEGYVSGMRMRGMDALYYILKDIERCLELGVRGFLVTDEGLLRILREWREKGIIPKETVFKVSVFAGHGSPAGARLLKELGANTFNPLADLTLPMLASIRQAVDLPLDVYITLVDAMGGFYRFSEAAEIARIAAPVYFKFEPGRSEGEIYKTWVEPSYKCFLVREKIREAQAVMEWVDRLGKGIICSGDRPADLSLPG